MKIIENIKQKLAGIINAFSRYPLTVIILIAIAIINMMNINNLDNDYSKYILSLIVGAMISVVAQQLYEHFFASRRDWALLMLGAILLTFVYFLSIGVTSNFEVENSVKTTVIVFALFMAFIWIPSIKSEVDFNDSFLATFKAFFTMVLFTIVVAAGINLIIVAIDNLLFSLDYKVYLHALNFIGSLFAPIFFLSLIPNYIGNADINESEEQLQLKRQEVAKAISYPKNLSNLISYVIIPLVIVYTAILLIYILLNIRADFWSENLMEPLLVSYAVTVIIVYILASNLNEKIADMFRKIFPKILIVIVLFQTTASVLKIADTGMTHGRYYVIMFGIFALISGIIFSYSAVKKNGLIVAVLLVFSTISIIPTVGAFSVSKGNQLKILEKALIRNEMFIDNKIIPKENISTDDKIVITKAVNYLDEVDHIKKVSWLPSDAGHYDGFRRTFGFNETYGHITPDQNKGKYAYFNINDTFALDISEYDYMSSMFISSGNTGISTIELPSNNGSLKLVSENNDKTTFIKLKSANDEEIISFDTLSNFNTIFESDDEYKEQLTLDEATFIEENNQAKLKIIVESVDIYEKSYSANVNIFIKFK